jgi:hypothetical protein
MMQLQPPQPGLPIPGLNVVIAPIPLIYRPDEGRRVADVRIRVICDNDLRSRLLYSELTRNWTKTKFPLKKENLARLQELAEVQKLVLKHVTVVKRQDVWEEFRGWYKYPVYHLGTHGKLEEFDDRAFGTTSFPLLTMEAIVRGPGDIAEWKSKIQKVEKWDRNIFRQELFQWAFQNFPEEASKTLGDVIDDWSFESIYDKFELKFSDRKGAPKYVPAELELRPGIFPWDLPIQKPGEPTLLPGEK